MDIRWFQNRSNFFVQLAFNFETPYYSLFLGTLLFCFWLLFLEPQSCQKEVGFFTFVSLFGQKKAGIEFFLGLLSLFKISYFRVYAVQW